MVQSAATSAAVTQWRATVTGSCRDRRICTGVIRIECCMQPLISAGRFASLAMKRTERRTAAETDRLSMATSVANPLPAAPDGFAARHAGQVMAGPGPAARTLTLLT